jgi:site-specific recombinase XerD
MHIPTLNYWLNQKKLNKDGLAPIYLRVTINGTRTEISSKISIPFEKWDDKNSKVKGKQPIDIRYNKQLADLAIQVHQSIDVLVQNKFPINASNIKLAISGQLIKKTILLEVYQDFLLHLKGRIGNDYTESSFEINQTTFDQVKEFLIKERNENLPLEEFTNALYLRLELFLKKEKGNQHNTVYKKIERLKSMFKWAYSMEFAEKDLSRKFKMKKQKKVIVFLTQEELNRIHELKLITRLETIRDGFLFMCYTGLPFNEIESLEESNLSRKINGSYGLIFSRKKTSKNLPEIPLLPQALILLEKYKDHPKRIREKKLLPIPSNQNFNAYLKEIGTLAGIEKSITTHTGRKTFATTVALRNGMSMEVLSKILGHSNMRITQEHYAQVQNERVNEEFEKLSIKLDSDESRSATV